MPPKKAAPKAEDEKPADLAEEMPVWNDDELGAILASGGDAYSAEGPELLLPEPLRARVAEWLKPSEFVTGKAEAPAPAVLHVEPWPAAPPEEGADENEDGADPEPPPAVADSQEYSRDLKCEWDLAEQWSLGLHGLAVPTERAPPPPPEPAEEGAEGEEPPPAPPPAEPEDLGIDPTMASIAQAFLAIASSATPADPGSCLWEAVYPKNERGWPTVSESGIYAVKLWWDGQWRCIAVDDRVPVDSNGVPLLVHSVHAHELWPMLIAKALLRLGSARRASISAGLGPGTMLHHLAGWSVESVPANGADVAALLAPATDGAQNAIFVVDSGKLSSAADLDALPGHAMLTGPLLGAMPCLKVPPPPEPSETPPEEGDTDGENPAEAESEPEPEPEPEPLPPTHKQVPLPYSAFASLGGEVLICRPIGSIEHKQPVRKEAGNDAELGQCFCIEVAEPTELLVQLTATAASDPASSRQVAPELWCKVVVEAYEWSQPTYRRPVLVLSTLDFTCSTIVVPAGRWCYKLAISSTSNSQVDLIAKVPIAYGEEITVLEEQLEVKTTMTEGEPAGAAAGQIPLLFQCNLAVEAQADLCFDLRAADGGILAPSYFVITSEGEDGRQQQEHFCQRTPAINFQPGVAYSMMVLFCNAKAEGRPWRMRTLSKGAVPDIAVVLPQYAERVAKPYACVKYYPSKILFRTYLECTLGKDIEKAYTTLQLSVLGLKGGSVKLEVFADGVGTAWEAEDKCVVSATGRRVCCTSLAMELDKSTKVLLQGSVTDETCVDTNVEWLLDAYCTEPAVQLADDTAKADGFREIMASWETGSEGRAEKAAETRSQYLSASSSAPGAADANAEEEAAADDAAATPASDPIVKTGSTPAILPQEKRAVLKEERLSFVEQAAANAAAASKQRESQKTLRASKQQVLEQNLGADREQYVQAAGAAWAEREQYRTKRCEQIQRQKEVLAAAEVLQDVIRGAEEISPESINTLASVIVSSAALPDETAQVLTSILNKQAPDEAAAEAFKASLVETCGLEAEQVDGLVEYPDAEVVPAGAAASLCAVVSRPLYTVRMCIAAGSY